PVPAGGHRRPRGRGPARVCGDADDRGAQARPLRHDGRGRRRVGGPGAGDRGGPRVGPAGAAMGDGCGEVAPEGGVPEVARMTNLLDDRPWIEKEVPAKRQVRIGTFSVRRWVAIAAVIAAVVGGPLGVS